MQYDGEELHIYELMTIDRYKSRRVTVNFPDALYEKIALAADKETRTVSQQIVHLCGEAFETREKAGEGK
jgi:hypothetical protein